MIQPATFARYKHLIIEDFAGPPEPEESRLVEEELGSTLPAGYLNFLNAANGGNLDYAVRVPDGPEGGEYMFCDWYYPGRDDSGEYGYGTLLGELQMSRSWVGLPNQRLPFARDGGSSTVFLDLTPEGAGRVVACLHGLPARAGTRQEDIWVEVAPDFDAYLDRLFLPEEELSESVERLDEGLRTENELLIRANRDFLDLAFPNWREEFPEVARRCGRER